MSLAVVTPLGAFMGAKGPGKEDPVHVELGINGKYEYTNPDNGQKSQRDMPAVGVYKELVSSETAYTNYMQGFNHGPVRDAIAKLNPPNPDLLKNFDAAMKSWDAIAKNQTTVLDAIKKGDIQGWITAVKAVDQHYTEYAKYYEKLSVMPVEISMSNLKDGKGNDTNEMVSTRLINPVQRVPRYRLLTESFHKELTATKKIVSATSNDTDQISKLDGNIEKNSGALKIAKSMAAEMNYEKRVFDESKNFNNSIHKKGFLESSDSSLKKTIANISNLAKLKELPESEIKKLFDNVNTKGASKDTLKSFTELKSKTITDSKDYAQATVQAKAEADRKAEADAKMAKEGFIAASKASPKAVENKAPASHPPTNEPRAEAPARITPKVDPPKYAPPTTPPPMPPAPDTKSPMWGPPPSAPPPPVPKAAPPNVAPPKAPPPKPPSVASPQMPPPKAPQGDLLSELQAIKLKAVAQHPEIQEPKGVENVLKSAMNEQRNQVHDESDFDDEEMSADDKETFGADSFSSVQPIAHSLSNAIEKGKESKKETPAVGPSVPSKNRNA